ncbi:hypothetical protein BKA70DRAFT_732400 [Coprinopsis sp. MPI-PUGE-AT-0042]|nr:hypothetical protein BKA70DRAFT_732400 [Coprinopsis sp. MPI-PUGE-AT-0042]
MQRGSKKPDGPEMPLMPGDPPLPGGVRPHSLPYEEKSKKYRQRTGKSNKESDLLGLVMTEIREVSKEIEMSKIIEFHMAAARKEIRLRSSIRRIRQRGRRADHAVSGSGRQSPGIEPEVKVLIARYMKDLRSLRLVKEEEGKVLVEEEMKSRGLSDTAIDAGLIQLEVEDCLGADIEDILREIGCNFDDASRPSTTLRQHFSAQKSTEESERKTKAADQLSTEENIPSRRCSVSTAPGYSEFSGDCANIWRELHKRWECHRHNI